MLCTDHIVIYLKIQKSDTAKTTQEEFIAAPEEALAEEIQKKPESVIPKVEDTELKEKIDIINQQTELIDQKISEIKDELCSSGEKYKFCGGLNIPPEATVRGSEILFG